jgi:hypothetical protein
LWTTTIFTSSSSASGSPSTRVSTKKPTQRLQSNAIRSVFKFFVCLFLSQIFVQTRGNFNTSAEFRRCWTQQTLSLFDILQKMKNVVKNWKLWCCKFAAGFFQSKLSYLMRAQIFFSQFLLNKNKTFYFLAWSDVRSLLADWKGDWSISCFGPRWNQL